MNYKAFTPEFSKKILTPNLLERVNRKLKRRTRKIGAFSEGSMLRIAGSRLSGSARVQTLYSS